MEYINRSKTTKYGFALPTVLIASVVMLMVMSVAVSSVVSVRTALKAQYYEQLARTAGEAGIAYANACLAKNGNVPLWSDAKPLTPSTDCAGNQMLQPQVQVLVVAGGGGGGGNHGGGGGGGGVISNDTFAVTPTSYNVVIGAGGAGGSSTYTGGNGGNSQFGALIAIGGGGGGARISDNSVRQAAIGGSGGGGGGTIDGGTSLPAAGASGTTGQGAKGGNGSSGSTAGNGGGGGGASIAGGDASGTASGAGSSGYGGNGYLSDISGAHVYYGGGGSGGRWGSGIVGVPGLNGAGIGGNNTSVGNPAAANTGGGGGGGGAGGATGGAGGSGVVIVRYPTNGSVTATAPGVTPTIEGLYKVFRFTASGTFTVSATAQSTCPTDPRCSVMSNSTFRSSFSVTLPSLNSDGEAVTIPNTGYVELIRASTGTVWRTYKQPSAQAAAVPDLCSGQSSSSLGWVDAVSATQQDPITGASTAESITFSNAPVDGGRIYFRKGFTVNTNGTYTVTARTTSSQDVVKVYVDGTLRLTNSGAQTSGNATLTPGCHTITAQLSNETIVPNTSAFTLAVKDSGGAVIVTTDTSWRASAGSLVHFSEKDYYRSSQIWQTAQDSGTAATYNANWTPATADSTARVITAPASTGCPSTCPANSYLFYKDNDNVVTGSAIRARLSAICNDSCTVYLDGNEFMNSDGSSNIAQQTFTLPAGTHTIGVRGSNGTAGTSVIGVSLYNLDASTVLTRTDSSWYASNVTLSNVSAVNVFGYEDSFRPSPNDIP